MGSVSIPVSHSFSLYENSEIDTDHLLLENPEPNTQEHTNDCRNPIIDAQKHTDSLKNSVIDDDSVITDNDSLFSEYSNSSASSVSMFFLPQPALNQGQEAIAQILTSIAVSRILVLVVGKLDSYVVDRRMSRVLREFSNEIQELAIEKVQKDSLQLLRNRATCTQIAAKIREISILNTDRPNNPPDVPPPQLAEILVGYPEDDLPQQGVKKVDAWLQQPQPGIGREDLGPSNEFEGTSSIREKDFPPPLDELRNEQDSGSEDEDEATEIPQLAIQAFHTASQFYQSDRVQDLFLEAVRRKFIYPGKREESAPDDNALERARCKGTAPDGGVLGECERNVQGDGVLKDCEGRVPNDIALRDQETMQDENALEICEEMPDENVLGEHEFEGTAQDKNSLGEQGPKAEDTESSLLIEGDTNLWPEIFADGKSDIAFETTTPWSFSNKVKSWIEDKTQTPIIWWPLAPRRRPLQPHCVQVTWTCVSSYVADFCLVNVF
jgi:hypothetical protein